MDCSLMPIHVRRILVGGSSACGTPPNRIQTGLARIEGSPASPSNSRILPRCVRIIEGIAEKKQRDVSAVVNDILKSNIRLADAMRG